MCIGRDAPFVRSTRSHKIQTGTGQESTPFVRRIGRDKRRRVIGSRSFLWSADRTLPSMVSVSVDDNSP